jgi:hypothetical protein
MTRAKRVTRYVLFPLRCLICGDSFHPKRTDAKFCGPTCRKQFSRAKAAGERRDPSREELKMTPAAARKRLKPKPV